jgi:hypothetical protein
VSGKKKTKKKKMNKTNKEKNLEHDARMSARVRPKQAAYDYTLLEAIMRQWVKGNE